MGEEVAFGAVFEEGGFVRVVEGCEASFEAAAEASAEGRKEAREGVGEEDGEGDVGCASAEGGEDGTSPYRTLAAAAARRGGGARSWWGSFDLDEVAVLFA